MKKIVLFLVAIFSFLGLNGQDNILLDRNYWKQNPTIEEIKININNGNNPAQLNSNAFDPVCYAILENVDNNTIKFLIDLEGNEINKITHDARTYLFWAAYKGNFGLVKYLIENGAKTNLRDSNGNTVMLFMANAGQTNLKIYDYLIEHGADPVNELTTNGANSLLLLAPYIKDLSIIDYFIKKGISIESTDNNGNHIFNYAARTVNKTLIEHLIEKNFAYQVATKDGSNAFLFASRGTRSKQNTIEDFKYLESLGVDPNVVSKTGTNPLHYLASRSKNIAVIDYFLEKGVSVNQPDKNGNTPFLYAANRNDIAIVKKLSKTVKDINHKNKDGVSALAMAVESNNVSVVEFLLEMGADTNIADLKGNNLGYFLVMSYSARNKENFKNKVALLEKSQVNITAIQSEKNNLFHLAIDKKDKDLLAWVNSKNINVNAKNEEGLTPLHKAVMTANDDTLIKYLISIGADKSISTDFQESVYDLASENELLSKNSIDISFLK